MGMDNYLAEIEKRIENSLKGNISYKNIKGKTQPYLQWTQEGKTKSRYIKVDEREEIFNKVYERKSLEELAAELREKAANYASPLLLNVEAGPSQLYALTKGVKNYEKRECFARLLSFLREDSSEKVAILYGLRRTGKTTLMKQAIASLLPTELASTAFISLKNGATLTELNKDLKELQRRGFTFVFLD